MFKKLRNRFLILNLVIISVTMLLAFASIYLVTYRNVQNDIDMYLVRISEPNHKIDKLPGLSQLRPDSMQPSSVDNTKTNEVMVPPIENMEPPADRSISFSVITDQQWNKIYIASNLNMDDDFYESAKNIAVSQNKNTGRFKLDDSYWAYLIKPFSSGYRISFLDATDQHAILTNLVYTFLVVAFIMLILIFLISRFFANKSIMPVKAAFDKQKQFIADASHELKTPLAVINTNVDVLLSNSEDTISKQAKWLHYIKSESDRMTKLTNDLLYLTQVDYSDVKTIYSIFNLSETAENVILTMEAVIFEHNLSLHYEIEPGLKVRGNAEEIHEVIMILLDNALKYTNANGFVDISLKRRHNDAVLTVTNTGEGIPEEHIEKIFDRFYRTDKSRSRKLGGYGLGLAIARAIIEQHKGRIYAKSTVHEKTSFYVELPLVSDVAREV